MRDEALWRRHLTRENLGWWISERGGYLCAEHSAPSEVWEFCPSCPEDMDMLGAYMDQMALESVNIGYAATGAYRRQLYRLASSFATKPGGSMAVVNAQGLRQALAPLDCSSAPLERLLGYDDFGAQDQDIRPLDWWLSRVDHV